MPQSILDLSYSNTQNSNFQVWVSCPESLSSSSQTGYVFAVGDIDGNNKQDLLISAPARNRGTGWIFLFYDAVSGVFSSFQVGGCIDLTQTADAIFQGDGPGEWVGYSIDVGNMDGRMGDEIAVGVVQRSFGPAWPTGKVVIIPGSSVRYSGIYNLSDVAMTTIYGEQIGDECGSKVVIEPLTNSNPNLQDLVLCAEGYPASNYDGKCYVVPGRRTGFPSVIYLNQTQPQDRVTAIFAANPGDANCLGCLHGLTAGDRKIVLGAAYAGVGGEVYVIPASTTLPPQIYLSNYTNMGILSGDPGSTLGNSLYAKSNDLNGDSYLDVSVGNYASSNSNALYGRNGNTVPPTLYPNVTFAGGGDEVFMITRPGNKNADLFISNMGGNNDAGQVFGLPGYASLSGSYNLENANIIINGFQSSDAIGFSLNALYTNSNSAPLILLIGAPFADPTSIGYTTGMFYAVALNTNSFSPIPTPTPVPSPTPTPTVAPAITINLTNLGNTGITMSLGPTRRDSRQSTSGTQFGYAVASTDFNDDGLPDDIIGANTGEIFVRFGSDSPVSTPDLRRDADVIISEIEGDTDNTLAGGDFNLAGGDFNRDGIGDIAVGIPNTIPSKVLIFFGSTSPARNINAADANVTVTPINPNDRIGTSVQVTDGNLLTCAANGNKGTGECYVINWNSQLPSILNAKNARLIIQGRSKGDNLSQIAGADVNGDRRNDFVVGATNANKGTGGAYLFYNSSKLTGTVSVTKANVIFLGGKRGDKVGSRVALGKVVGNKVYADIFIAARGGNANAGIVYVVFGQKTMASQINLNSAANLQYYGIHPGDGLGSSAIVITDLDGDDDNDLLISADNANQIYGFLGNEGALQSGLAPSSVNVSTAPLVINGNGSAGFAVSASENRYQDREILIGAPASEEAYGVFLPIPGLASTPTPTPTPTPKKSHDESESSESSKRESYDDEIAVRSLRESAINDVEFSYASIPTPTPIPILLAPSVTMDEDIDEDAVLELLAPSVTAEQSWFGYAAQTASNAASYVTSFFNVWRDPLQFPAAAASSIHSAPTESRSFVDPSAPLRHSVENEESLAFSDKEHRLHQLQEMQAKLTTLIEAAGNNPVLLKELFEHEDQLIAWNENVEAIKTEELDALNFRIEALEQEGLRSARVSASTATSPFRFLPPPRITASSALPTLGTLAPINHTLSL